MLVTPHPRRVLTRRVGNRDGLVEGECGEAMVVTAVEAAAAVASALAPIAPTPMPPSRRADRASAGRTTPRPEEAREEDVPRVDALAGLHEHVGHAAVRT